MVIHDRICAWYPSSGHLGGMGLLVDVLLFFKAKTQNPLRCVSVDCDL